MDLFQAAQDTGRSAVNLAFAIAVCVTTLIILIGVFLLAAPDSVTENDLKNEESNNVSVGVTNSLSGPAFGTLLVVVGVVGLAISTWNSISALKKPSVLQMIGLRGIHVHVSSK